jgi:penicillin amidase
MISMVRRWLGNDTWELLGAPVPPAPAGHEADEASRARERRERVLAALPAALAGAWAAAVREAGPDPAQWRWGDQHRAVRVHPLSGAGVPTELSPDASAHSVRMGGDADTIQAAAYRWRQDSPFTVTALSVYRQVVDLGDPASASFVIPGGASGDPASPHYADQFTRWAAHQRIPVPGGGSA